MWTLVILSHILMFVSFVMLSTSAIKGHFIYSESTITLNSYSILAVMMYVFTQSLIFFLIITINKNMNTLIVEHSISIKNANYKYYKKQMHIHTSSNILYISTIAILFGAVHTGLMGECIHNILFILGILHYGYVIKIQYFCFKEISKIISRINDTIISKL